MDEMRHLFITLPILIILSVSCNCVETRHLLDDVDSYIRQCPDSALAVLRTVDDRELNTKKLRARYSLLFAMALDKNYIDTTDVSVVMPAVQYYRKHGDPDDKLRAYFYLGNIYLNSKQFNKAAEAYSLAEAEAEKAKDEVQKGLLYMNFSFMYNKVHNVDKELKYAEKGLACYKAAGDTSHINITYGDLALIYHSKYDWVRADSLYQLGLERAGYDTLVVVNLLSNYAKMKMIQTNPDPRGAISLLTEKTSAYHCPLSVMDYGVYAYASDLLGDRITCDRILNQLEILDEFHRKPALVWLSMIYRNRGEYKKALDYELATMANNYKVLDSLLAVPVSEGLNDYFSAVANESRAKSQSIVIVSVSSLVVIILIFVILLLSQRLSRMRERENADRMLTLAEDTNRFMSEKNNQLIELNARYENERDTLRKSFVSIYKDKFTAVGELCRTYVESKDRADKKELIYYRVENLIADILNDDKRHLKFEERINSDLDNIITHLKEDLGDLDRKDVRLLCYLIAGFDTSTISAVLNMTATNIYTKKSRFKDRIRHLDSIYREDYLRML